MDIKNFLIEKYGYDPKTVHVMVKQLENLSGAFKVAYQAWLKTGENATAGEVHGYTVNRLMQEHNMNYPAALTTLSWIAKDGEKAIRMIRRGIK